LAEGSGHSEKIWLMTMPSKITAILVAHPGKSVELRELLVGMAPRCRAEPGNLRWDVWRDSSNDHRYVLDELYRDVAAVEAHRASQHYLAYLAKVPELAERTAVIAEVVDVIGVIDILAVPSAASSLHEHVVARRHGDDCA
jgi:quinol monooxygenase YgiN